MRKKRKPKKRIGINQIATSIVLLLTIFLPLGAAPKKKPALDTYAVVSGNVFQESGYALPDAAVILVAEAPAGGEAAKAQKIEAISDSRGEFVLRVPPGPRHYTVIVSAKGYQSERKTVAVEDQERVEVTFQLERESK